MKKVVRLIVLLGMIIGGFWYTQRYLPPGTMVYAEVGMIKDETRSGNGDQLTGYDDCGNLVRVSFDTADLKKLPQHGYLRFYYRQGRIVSYRQVGLDQIPKKALTRLHLVAR
ncbi:hypothetical protein [Lapidilactobacillus luobeiensis]|uniref:hypothetical protein n=1 Tax=Lapidilactobacillus luobeiensis TaxID=2950371 RepID=UPI0021C37139|nr:hypothetical protein [Lapidilactobacillus luobeiensis]